MRQSPDKREVGQSPAGVRIPRSPPQIDPPSGTRLNARPLIRLGGLSGVCGLITHLATRPAQAGLFVASAPTTGAVALKLFDPFLLVFGLFERGDRRAIFRRFALDSQRASCRFA